MENNKIKLAKEAFRHMYEMACSYRDKAEEERQEKEKQRARADALEKMIQEYERQKEEESLQIQSELRECAKAIGRLQMEYGQSQEVAQQYQVELRGLKQSVEDGLENIESQVEIMIRDYLREMVNDLDVCVRDVQKREKSQATQALPAPCDMEEQNAQEGSEEPGGCSEEQDKPFGLEQDM